MLEAQFYLVFLSLFSQMKVFLNLGYFEENVINLMERTQFAPISDVLMSLYLYFLAVFLQVLWYCVSCFFTSVVHTGAS